MTRSNIWHIRYTKYSHVCHSSTPQFIYTDAIFHLSTVQVLWIKHANKKKYIKNSRGEVFGQRFCLPWGDSLPIKLIRGSDISALLSLHCRDVTADSKYSTRNSGPDATGVQAAEPSESDAVRGMFCPNPKREHQSKHEWSHGGQIRERWEIFFFFFLKKVATMSDGRNTVMKDR